jgi:hypothetical protein
MTWRLTSSSVVKNFGGYMKSRTSSAATFGFILAVFLVVITMFIPTITKVQCGGEVQATYEFFGVSAMSFTLGEVDPNCTGGTQVQATGFPFATRDVVSNIGTLQPGENPGLELNISGLLANLMIFWLGGFLFFFLFSGGTGNKRNAKNQSLRSGNNDRIY